MRVTFPRLPDHRRAFALVERDDGTVYRLDGGVAGSRLPHDIVHLVVERELGIGDGIWAGIAAGLVFGSMTHVSGRRQPHAAERSRGLLRDFGERGLRAELLADLVTSAAALNDPSPARITRLAAEKLAVLPDGDARADPARIATAAAALQVEAARWARLRVGEELCYDWPGRPPGRAANGSTRPINDGSTQPIADGSKQPMTGPASEQPPALIEREGLTLRRWRPADADDLAGVVRASLDHLAPWLPWATPGYDGESAAQFIERSIQGWGDGSLYNYAIVGDSIAGGCGLMRRIGPGGMEIGYWVAKDQTRRGLATRAAEVLTEEAFRLPGVDRVEIWTDELNKASAAIPARLGFTRVGTEPSEMPPPGGTGVCVVWRLARPAT